MAGQAAVNCGGGTGIVGGRHHKPAFAGGHCAGTCGRKGCRALSTGRCPTRLRGRSPSAVLPARLCGLRQPSSSADAGAAAHGQGQVPVPSAGPQRPCRGSGSHRPAPFRSGHRSLHPKTRHITQPPLRTVRSGRSQALPGGIDRARAARLAGFAGCRDVLSIAINGVFYHLPERRPQQDVLTAIREHAMVQNDGYQPNANAE